VVEYTVTRLRRLVRERSSGETMSIEELSEVPWLEMWDLIDAGLANRGDLSQALFMRDLRPLHPEMVAHRAAALDRRRSVATRHQVRPAVSILRALREAFRPRHPHERPPLLHVRSRRREPALPISQRAAEELVSA
jgi:hypothetical protein